MPPNSALFPGMEAYTQMLSVLGFTWPHSSLDDRVSYYEIAVRTVSETLRAAGRLPQVGGHISAVAFTSNGLAVDRRIPGVSALLVRRRRDGRLLFGTAEHRMQPSATLLSARSARLIWGGWGRCSTSGREPSVD